MRPAFLDMDAHIANHPLLMYNYFSIKGCLCWCFLPRMTLARGHCRWAKDLVGQILAWTCTMHARRTLFLLWLMCGLLPFGMTQTYETCLQHWIHDMSVSCKKCTANKGSVKPCGGERPCTLKVLGAMVVANLRPCALFCKPFCQPCSRELTHVLAV